MYELVPLAAPLSNRPLIWIGGRTGVCLASRQIVQCTTDGCFAWQAAIRWETDSGLRPGHIVWEEARCILLGFGSEVRALAVGDGEELLHVAVGDYVGSLALTPDAASALVLTGTDVLAFDRRLKQIWQATNLAIDGVCIEELRDDAVLLNAEMDPPAGWMHVSVDLQTGAVRGRSFISTVLGPDDGPYRCPCCRLRTLAQRGGYEICSVCFWEDDGQDDADANLVRGGPNGLLSLSAARENYKRIGASDERDIAHVRPPTPEEGRDLRERLWRRAGR